jgi:dihydrofolate synthase/folylpolyglutamate synthase
MQRTDPAYCQALRFLLDRINYEKTVDRPYHASEFKLARMSYLLEQLGNPQLATPVLHVAGTKGKGSVCWLLAEALRLSGRKTGLFTSPHLVHLEERFVINGSAVAPSLLVCGVDQIREAEAKCSASEHGQPTFFELSTALAWVLFRQANTDVNVIEVGLGGRLDSTNICSPALCVITSISYDHQQQLGETLTEIAGEKGGIIKNHTPVICGARSEEAARVLRSIAKTRNAEILELGKDFEVQWTAPSENKSKQTPNRTKWDCPASKITVASNISSADLRSFDLRMIGAHQADNAALVVAAWKKLQTIGWNLDDDALAESLKETQVPARLEFIANSPPWILDAGHNEASITALLDSLDAYFPNHPLSIVFACSKDKKYREMLELIAPKAHRLVLTQFQSNPRFTPVEKLQSLTHEILHASKSTKHQQPEVFSAPDLATALNYVQKNPIATQHSKSASELVVITGSFFIAAEAKALLLDDC